MAKEKTTSKQEKTSKTKKPTKKPQVDESTTVYVLQAIYKVKCDQDYPKILGIYSTHEEAAKQWKKFKKRYDWTGSGNITTYETNIIANEYHLNTKVTKYYSDSDE